MKKSYGKFIVLGSLVTLTLAYSCKKLLNKAPVGVLGATQLANKAGVDGILIGAYSALDGYTNTGLERFHCSKMDRQLQRHSARQ